MQDKAFASDQQQQAARTARIEQETALQPEQVEVQRQNQDILNFYRQKQGEHLEAITARLTQQMKLEPENIRREQLNAFARMAQDKARRDAEMEMVRMRLAVSPEDAALKLAQIESEQAQAEYYRSGAGLREAQAGNVGKEQEPRMPNAASLANTISILRDRLWARHSKPDINADDYPNTKIVDHAAMASDPDYARYQGLEKQYADLYGQPEAASGGGPRLSPYEVRGGRPSAAPSPFDLGGAGSGATEWAEYKNRRRR
jgi:hypothetical protein